MAPKTKYILLGVGALVLVGAVYGAQKASQLQSLGDKIKIGPIIPRIHNISSGAALVKVDKIDITNQSSLPIAIDQLYVNIKSSGSDLATQTKPIAPLTIPAYGQATLKDIELQIPYTTLPAIIEFITGKVQRKLDISIRVSSSGFEVPFNQTIDSSSIFESGKSMLKSMLPSMFSLN